MLRIRINQDIKILSKGYKDRQVEAYGLDLEVKDRYQEHFKAYLMHMRTPAMANRYQGPICRIGFLTCNISETAITLLAAPK